jgi:hypothetical protein
MSKFPDLKRTQPPHLAKMTRLPEVGNVRFYAFDPQS